MTPSLVPIAAARSTSRTSERYLIFGRQSVKWRLMKNFLLTTSMFCLVLMTTIFLIPAKSFAQSAGTAQGVQLSPSIIELNAKRGGTYTLTVEVTNVTAGDLEYRVSTNDFTSKNETGSPKILYDSSLPPQVSIRSWVASVPDFRLGSHKSAKIEFHVTVPRDAEPGGHYGVLDFSGSNTKIKQTGVGLTASAGTLLLVKIAGDVKEQASVASFYTENNGKASNFFEMSPVNFVTRVQNSGNMHLKPFGSIELKNMVGTIVATLPVNKIQSNVLPSSIRRFDNKYGDYMFGLYTASVTLGYGSQGQAIMASTSFWVIPYKLIATILLVLALIAFILRRLQVAYNRRVIKKYKNAQQKDNSKTNKQ